MQVVVTVPSIEDESAGPSYTVPALCDALHKAGVGVSLHVIGGLPKRAWAYPVVAYKKAKSALLRRIGRSPDMLHGFRAAVKDGARIIHVNGVWQLADIYPNRARKGSGCKVVYCPRGGLSATAIWRGKTLLKRIMWYLGGQRKAFLETDMWHAASLKEMSEIRALGFRQPVAVIPNGIELPEVEHREFGGAERHIVYLGRLHVTKAVDHLVEAWGRVADQFPLWSLQIAGPDCGAVPALRDLIAAKQIPRVSFVGELHGIEKYRFLAQADLFVLPSLTENFGMTIAEALACGTPVIASKGCPWEKLGPQGCGWHVEIGVDALERQLSMSLTLPPGDLQAMGQNGRTWMLKDFSWDGVGWKMKAAYDWLTAGGDRPEWVYVD